MPMQAHAHAMPMQVVAAARQLSPAAPPPPLLSGGRVRGARVLRAALLLGGSLRRVRVCWTRGR